MNAKILYLLGLLVGSFFVASSQSYEVFMKSEGEVGLIRKVFDIASKKATVADLKIEMAKVFGEKLPQALGYFLLCKDEIGAHIVYDYEQLNTILSRVFLVKKYSCFPIGLKLPDEIDDFSGDRPDKRLFAELLKHQNFLWSRLKKVQEAALEAVWPATGHFFDPNILACLERAHMDIGYRVNTAISNIRESGGAVATVARVDGLYAGHPCFFAARR
jgi:hypothetical protein